MDYFVYILRSQSDSNQIYIGYTADIERRMSEHLNPPMNAYTRKHSPWQLETYVVFNKQSLALNFEKYLKDHSGRAFLIKRLIS